jgi:hypothetical protein
MRESYFWWLLMTILAMGKLNIVHRLRCGGRATLCLYKTLHRSYCVTVSTATLLQLTKLKSAQRYSRVIVE